MQAWPLTGRAEELEVIADVFRADGPHAGVLIAGSAGVGKTRLAREAMAAARNCGWAVHWVAGTVAAQSIPLGAFAQWADRLEGNPGPRADQICHCDVRGQLRAHPDARGLGARLAFPCIDFGVWQGIVKSVGN